jgi:surface protein
MNFVLIPDRNKRGETGINMVDLMMWLVIAAMLLAAALQGIGYYQKAAYLYQLKANTDAAGTNSLTAAAKDDGEINLAAANDGVAATTWNEGVTSTVKTASDGTPYIVVSSDSLTDTEAIYLFSACGDDYTVGVNVVPKTSDPALEACGVNTSPEGEGAVAEPMPTGRMVSVWNTDLIHEVTPVDPVTGDWGYEEVACTTITLPLHGVVNADIDWGDGTLEKVTSGFPTHTYTGTTGSKTVTIDGSFSDWGGEPSWSEYPGYIQEWTPECITSVTEWGTTGTTSLRDAFYYAYNLTSVAEIPSGVTDMNDAFFRATLFNSPVGSWDTSKVTNMSGLFVMAYAFNQDISGWETGNVTDMSWMFASSSVNSDISSWNTSKVTNMYAMFNDSSINSDVSGWETSNVTNMSEMFSSISPTFNPDLSDWDVSKVTNFSRMFAQSPSLNIDLSQWETSSAIDMNSMFNGALSFNSDISGWDTSNVKYMSYMFNNAKAFNQDISGWETGNVEDMSGMFLDTTAFDQNLSEWDVAKVTNYSDFWSGKTEGYKPLFV